MKILYVLLIIFSILGLFGFIFKISKEEKNDLLKKMLKNNEISNDVYIKYFDK